MANQNIPVNEKYMLSINEAAQYFNIGVKKMRRLAEDNLGVFAVYSGNRYLIIRCKFEEFLLSCLTGKGFEGDLKRIPGKG